MQSKIELQRQKINAVRKLLRSAGPLCGTVALIAGQVIVPMHRWWIVAVGVRNPTREFHSIDGLATSKVGHLILYPIGSSSRNGSRKLIRLLGNAVAMAVPFRRNPTAKQSLGRE